MRNTGIMKAAAVLALLSASASACVGDDGAVSRAKQQCQAREISPGTAAYDKCVHEESEKIYINWGRDNQFMGLD